MPSQDNYSMTKPGMFKLKPPLCGTVGVCLISLGIIISLAFPRLFEYILYQQLVLRKGSETCKIWEQPPVPIYMNFYLYNWTNPDELGIEKPNLVELGPYRFNEIDKKTDVIWNENGTVTFERKRKWYFDEERSNGSLQDEITTLNPVALTAAKSVNYWSRFMKVSLSTTISFHKQKISVTRTVGEMLFDGYTDPLLDFAKQLPSFAGINIPYDRFGWFYLRNGSDVFDGVFNMDTGINGISQLGKLHNWNYSNRTSFYDGDCGKITGTAGELFHPDVTKFENVEMFTPDLCRSVTLKFGGETEMYGIKANKYVGGKDIVDNGTLDARNECYCDGECVPAGVVNVTSCRLGAPGFVSFPHFYLADEFYREQVDGMSPKPEKHTLYLALEPTTGIPLDVAARFQINLLLSPQSSISLYRNVPRIFFPMIWFEQRATISESLANTLKTVLAIPSIGQGLSFLLIAIGLLLTVLHLYRICQQRYRPSVTADGIKLHEATMNPLITPVKENGTQETGAHCEFITQRT